MLSFGNEKKNPVKDKWNHCNHMPMISLMGDYHRLPLFHMSKSFIWIEGTKQRIN